MVKTLPKEMNELTELMAKPQLKGVLPLLKQIKQELKVNATALKSLG